MLACQRFISPRINTRHRRCTTCASQVRDAASAVKYAQQMQLVAEGLAAEAEELPGGRINYVFKLSQPSGTTAPLLLKYCPPYVKCMGADVFPLTQERSRVEEQALRAMQAVCPEHVPQLVHYDAESFILVTQYLDSHLPLTEAMHDKHLVLPWLGKKLGSFLGRALFFNSVYFKGEDKMQPWLKVFENKEVKLANEQVVLTESLYGGSSARCYSRQLDPLVDALRSDPEVAQAHAYLVDAYRDSKEALIHNDLHPGNILVYVDQRPDASMASVGQGHVAGAAETTQYHNSMRVIDFELATVGPMAFDIGSLTGSLLLAYLVSASSSNSEEQPRWLLGIVGTVWAELVSSFEGRATVPDMQQVWRQMLGFAGLCMIRLTIGVHHYQGYDTLSEEQRIVCSAQAVRVARQMLVACSKGDNSFDAEALQGAAEACAGQRVVA